MCSTTLVSHPFAGQARLYCAAMLHSLTDRKMVSFEKRVWDVIATQTHTTRTHSPIRGDSPSPDGSKPVSANCEKKIDCNGIFISGFALKQKDEPQLFVRIWILRREATKTCGVTLIIKSGVFFFFLKRNVCPINIVLDRNFGCLDGIFCRCDQLGFFVYLFELDLIENMHERSALVCFSALSHIYKLSVRSNILFCDKNSLNSFVKKCCKRNCFHAFIKI